MRRDNAPDRREPEALGKSLRDEDVCVLVNKRACRVDALVAGKVNVGLVDEDDALERRVLKDRDDVLDRDERARRITGRAEKDDLDQRIGGKGSVNLTMG